MVGIADNNAEKWLNSNISTISKRSANLH
jgi:hypothetical protein